MYCRLQNACPRTVTNYCSARILMLFLGHSYLCIKADMIFAAKADNISKDLKRNPGQDTHEGFSPVSYIISQFFELAHKYGAIVCSKILPSPSYENIIIMGTAITYIIKISSPLLDGNLDDEKWL